MGPWNASQCEEECAASDLAGIVEESGRIGRVAAKNATGLEGFKRHQELETWSI